MNSNVIPISQARAKLPDLVKEASDLSRKTYITVKGRVKAVLMSVEEAESLDASEEILSDPEAIQAITQGLDDVKHNRLIDWTQVKKKLAA